MLVATSGMIMVDRVAINLPEEPHSGKTQFTETPIEEHIGGHPANVAIDLVKLGLNSSEIGVVASIGKDSGAKLVETTLENYGVERFLSKSDKPALKDIL